MQIVILENNSILKETLTNQTNIDENIKFIFFSEIKDLKKKISMQNCDFLIVTSFLPKLSSFEVLERISDNIKNKKIIQILEKKKDKRHDSSTFCFEKPVNINELVSIFYKLNTKQKKIKTKAINLINRITFIKKNRELVSKNNNVRLRLTEKESEIINYLSTEKKFFDKIGILKKIWKFNNKVKTRTLETHVYRLRKKVKNKFGIKEFITAKKNSYKLN